jgi:photosystem II stability/assembly factor-like uncharacterized protein
MFSESDIRVIAVDPNDTSILFAGTEAGLYRSKNGGDEWERLESALNDRQIWSMAIDPRNSDTIYVGTCPSAFFRSDDGGDSWKQLTVELAEDCGSIIPRVTTMIIDPEDSQTVYAGIEIDGMRVSRDGGETWEAGNEGLSSLDVHGLTVVPGQTKTLVAATNNDVCITTDLVNWTPLKVREHFPWPYCRSALYLSASSNRIYVGAGNGPPGDQGGLFYTSDLGETWERADFGGNSNSTIWAVVHNPAVSDWIMAYSVSGQIFRSTDNGESWEKLAREFGEVRAVAIV